MLPKNAYLNAFAHIPAIGPRSLTRLLTYFQGDLERTWMELPRAPEQLFKRTPKAEVIKQWQKIHVQDAWKKLADLHIQTVSTEEADYPHLLKKIHDAPYLLYTYGKLPTITQPLLTVVGTRRISDYGNTALRHLLTPVAAAGIGLVSGLAFGVDAQTHRLAIKEGTYTLAVLGSGVDRITPPTHENLAKELLASGGAIISEFPPGTESFPSHFPRRNRILAGLSPMTLVIEAAEKSGALITARYALNENRDVAAVPGPIDSPTSAGCLGLIKDGAQTITSPEEILAYFGMNMDTPRSTISLTEAETNLIRHLERTPVTLDSLLQKSRLNHGAILAILTALEIKGAIRQIPGRGYSLQ
jgi:DNA processing protein